MAEKKKFYTRDIRLNGKLVRSPRFQTKREADLWYEYKKHERDAMFRSYEVKLDRKTTLHDFFYGNWFLKREEKYPKSTTLSDKQRFEKYIKPSMGHLVVSMINTLQIRKCLMDVVDVHKQSIQTRNRVRALLSKMFSDAMNDTRLPLRDSNPAINITFDDPRQGKFEPEYIAKEKDILTYMKTAKTLGPGFLVIASLGLMAGLRKSEIIPLKWGDVDFDDTNINVNKHYEQASMSVQPGTKAGAKETRDVTIPDSLIKILREIKEKADFHADDDFVLCDSDGELIKPRPYASMADLIAKTSGVKITPHGLRHTYGREFAKRSGNMKALQAILGHSNSTVTDLYSKLAGKHVSKHRNTVSFDLGDDEND